MLKNTNNMTIKREYCLEIIFIKNLKSLNYYRNQALKRLLKINMRIIISFAHPW